MKKNHKERMLEWIDRMGLIVIHAEIAPYGPGTRRYMVGRHIEAPTKQGTLPSGKLQMTRGVQEWLTEEPLDGPQLEKWLGDWEKNPR